MSEDTASNILREKIKSIGVAKVAKAAKVSATTIYSFCSGDTQHLRSDTRRKVLDALTQFGIEEDEDSLQTIVEMYKFLPPARRRLLANMARELAEKKGEK